jgi:hypothetical protein
MSVWMVRIPCMSLCKYLCKYWGQILTTPRSVCDHPRSDPDYPPVSL